MFRFRARTHSWAPFWALSLAISLSSHAATPHIASLSPTSGPAGASVTIFGSNFGASQGTSTVKFSGKAAGPATSWSAAKIVVKVPAGAQTGKVIVTVKGIQSNGVAFTVSPKIAGLSPTSGPVGTSVTISGSDFGSLQGTSTVDFSGKSAGIATSWSATKIVAKVPVGAKTGKVVVTVKGFASNGLMFTVTTGSACSGGGKAAGLLKGDYTFLEQGFGDPSQAFFVFAGRFHADGVNTISKGLLEYNSEGHGSSNGAPLPFKGCFVLNLPSNSSGHAMGTMTVVNSAGALLYTFAIAVLAEGNGRLIQFDKDQNFRGAGYFEKQCPNAVDGACSTFADSNVVGDYGLAFIGFITHTQTSNAALVGRLHSNGSGGTSNAVMDDSTSANVSALNDPFTASYKVTDAINGRVRIKAEITYNDGYANGTTETIHFGCYLGGFNNLGRATILYCIDTDTPSGTLPLVVGRFIAQDTPSGGWTNANLSPASKASVIWSTGIAAGGTARVLVGQFTYNTSANPPTVSASEDVNKGGGLYGFVQGTAEIGVAANGRLQITAGGSLLTVCYMLDAGKGVCVDEANHASLDFVLPQATQPSGGFTLADFDNTFAFGSVNPMTVGVTDVDGVATSRGSSGKFDGGEYVNDATSGLSSPGLSATYSIPSASDAAIGRYVVSVTSPKDDTWILYLIDANTAIAVSTSDPEPGLMYFVH